MLTLTFLGSSAALPNIGRFNVAFVVQSDESSTILFECGPNILYQLNNAELDPCQVKYLFISHIHGDHVLGFPMLILHRYNHCAEPLRVICSDSVVKGLKKIVSLVYPEISNYLDKHCHFIAPPTKAKYTSEMENGLHVSTLPVIHGVPTLAFRLDYPDKSIVYSADTAPSPSMAKFADGSDVLIHDANFSATIDPNIELVDHSTARAAAEIAKKANAKILVLVHLHKKYAGQEHVFHKEASSVYSGKIFIPTQMSSLIVT